MEGATQVRCRSASEPDIDGGWIVISREGPCGGEGRMLRKIFLARTADGSVAMPILEDHEHNRKTVFDPPLVMFPSAMAPGTVHLGKTTLSSGDINGEGSKRGTATCETKYLPDGRLETIMVFRLSPAVVRRTTIWTLDETGRILHEDERRTLHVGPVRIENQHVSIRVADAPAD